MQNNQLIKILITGEGGQGVQTIAKILANACYRQKYEVCYMPHYGVEMRMGISLAYLQIGVLPIPYPKFNKADILVCLTSRDINQTKSFYWRDTEIINAMNLANYMNENNISVKSLNMLVLGIITKKIKEKLPMETEKIRNEIREFLGEKQGLAENLEAFGKGINLEDRYFRLSLDKYPRRNRQPSCVKNNQREYYHWPSHCKACGLCIEKCPTKALVFSQDRINYFGRYVPVVDIEKCISCKTCEQICPDIAIRVVKK